MKFRSWPPSKTKSFFVFILSFVFISTFFTNCSNQSFKLSESTGTDLSFSLLAAPQIILNQEIPVLINSQDLTISFAVNSASDIESVSCQLNDQEITDCRALSISYSNLTDGDYTFTILARNVSGASTELSRIFRKDGTSPAISIAMQPAAVTALTSAQIIFSAVDSLSGIQSVECSHNNATFSACSSPVLLSNLSAGAHAFQIRARDQAGNLSQTTNISWSIDLTVPSVNLTGTPSSVTNTSNATFIFSGNSLVSYECSLDNAAFAACVSPQSYSNLASSAHNFRVRGRNAANVLSEIQTYNWVVDTVAPSAPVLIHNLSQLTNLSAVSFSFTSSDNSGSGIAGYQCSLNNAAFANCTSPRALTNLVDGNQNFRVRAVDNASNMSSESNYSWVIDSVAPSLSFTQPPTNSTSNSVTITFTATDASGALDLLQCSLNNTAFSNCTSPVSLNNLAIGNQNFRVQARDRAGNSSMISANWMVSSVIPPNSSITARLAATRVSGVAPLAVQFDATASSSSAVTYAFHELMYDFNFGDERGLTWGVTGRSKNTQNGAPLAAHVYDIPGTYTAQVRVYNPTSNEQAYASITITVLDPETAYSGTNTVCVSTSGNYTGCPVGAFRQTNLPAVYENKRVLLRRGETFPGVSIPPTDDNVMVATFGSGNKPIVDQVNLGHRGNLGEWPDEVVIMDLNIRNGFSISATGSRVLLYRCDMIEPNTNKIDVGTALGYYIENSTAPRTSYYWPREIFLVENEVIGDTNSDEMPGIIVMGFFAKSALLGNRLNRATQHTVRIWAGYKTVLAHNFIGGEHYAANPPGIRAALKVHSSGTSSYQDNISASTLNIATRFMVTADNRFGTTAYLGSWMTGFSPQNADQGTVEGLEDILMERDIFTRGPYSSQDIHNVARRSTVRGASGAGGAPLLMHQVRPNQWSGDPGLLPWIGPYFGQPSTY